MRHHDNHAYFSYAVSPFPPSDQPMAIAVLDGIGDDGAISLYSAQRDGIRLLYRNQGIFDSLGTFYSIISSTQGGWTLLSSEGRYMGAAAWGNGERLTNPYYQQLRELFYFHTDGRLYLNRALATLAAALRWFNLSPGASDDEYNAYNYMVLTARARPESHAMIPAVIHRDGTGRIQIVREEADPLTYAYLKALGRRIGVEVAVNTSLNVGGPIVQTPTQALRTLKRSKGMDGIVMVGDDGDIFLVWHNLLAPPKDAGRRLQEWLQDWQAEAGEGDQETRRQGDKENIRTTVC